MNRLFEKINKLIERKYYLEDIKSLINSKLINVIIGPRRVGKTFFLYSVIKYLLENNIINSSQIFYINKERLEFDFIKTYKDLFNYFQNSNIDISKTFFIGLDEIQEVEGWEKFVLDIYSKYEKAIIFITGSNSKLLSSQYSTLLSGRFLEKVIYPLSFKEFCKFSNTDCDKTSFFEYLEFGGLPKVPLIKDKEIKYEYLNSVYNTVFIKDIVEFFKIRNISLLKNLHYYLFKELGKYFTATNIANFLKNQKIKVSVDTILNYLEYSKAAFLFNELKRYDIKGKKILQINSKIYPFDLGIRNALVGFNPLTEIERYLETIVLNHLLAQGYMVTVGNLDNKEIDFIAEKNKEKIYIQVCYLLNDQKVIDREFGNLLKIKDNREKIVISMDELPISNYEGIKHYNIIDWLKNLPI